jgi:hypothetical protein
MKMHIEHKHNRPIGKKQTEIFFFEKKSRENKKFKNVTRIKFLLIFVVFWFYTFGGTMETYTIFVKFTDKFFLTCMLWTKEARKLGC